MTTSALAPAEPPPAFLGASAPQARWLFLPSDTGQIVPVPRIVPVPLAAPWFAGLAAIRGHLFSVVDFARFHGLEATPLSASARLLLFAPSRQLHTALLFGRIEGLCPLERFHRAPPADPAFPWIVGHWQDSDNAVWQQIDLTALTTHPHFLEAAARVQEATA